MKLDLNMHMCKNVFTSEGGEIQIVTGCHV